jgi:hypothetical protein
VLAAVSLSRSRSRASSISRGTLSNRSAMKYPAASAWSWLARASGSGGEISSGAARPAASSLSPSS